MSDLSADAARWADLIAGMPQRVASTAKTQADIAETYQGQIPLQQAQAQGIYQGQIPQAQAEAGYYGALGTKTQIDADMNRIILDRMRAGQQQGNTQSGYTGLPPDLPGGTTTTPTGGGGGRNIGPGTGGQPGETTGGLMSYAQPPPNVPGAGSTALAMATPTPPPPQGGGITARYPGSFQTAQADTGVTSDVQPTTVVPGSATLAAGGPQPPPGAPLGFGGVNVGGGPLMFGQTTAQNVPPGSTQMGRQTPDTTPPFMQGSGAGEYLPELGKFVPRQLVTPYLRALTQGGPGAAEALQTIDKARTNYLLQQAYAATTPDAWNKAVEREYLAGYLSVQDYQTYHTHPELRVEAIRALQPEITTQQNNAMAQQGMSWSDTVHQYVWDTRLHAGARPEQAGWTRNADGTYSPNLLTSNEIAARSGVPIIGIGGETQQGPPGGQPPPQGPAPQGPPGPPGPQGNANPFDAYAAAVHAHEGSSPTMGNYGWIPSTKAAMARKYAPDEVAGLTDAQIAARQLSPQAENAMMRGFTSENADTLQKAGIRPSGSNLGMAHYIGPQGVINLTKVSPDTTLAQMEAQGLLPRGTVANNPELQGNTTARGFIQWAHGKYGNDTLTPAMIASGGRATVAGPGAGTSQQQPPPSPTPSGGPGGGQYQGRPEAPIGGESMVSEDKARIDEDYAAAHEAQTAGRQAGAQTMTIMDLQHRLSNIAPGSGGEWRAQMENWINTNMPQRLHDWTRWATGHDFNDAADRSAAIKEFTALALQQEAQMPGVRSGIGLAEMNAHASPNINMPEKTISDLTNAMLVRNQAIKDYGEGFQPLIDPRYAAWRTPTGGMPAPYKPVRPEWDQEWNKADSIHAPIVYQAATDMLNGHTGAEMDKWYGKLTKDQQAEVAHIILRINPQWHPATAAAQ